MGYRFDFCFSLELKLKMINYCVLDDFFEFIEIWIGVMEEVVLLVF